MSPVYVGSAIFEDSVHPCKIAPSVHPSCRVAFGGIEKDHHGRYDLLPITPEMEWVQTHNGELPPGRRLVEGGYESNGEKLYHALGKIGEVEVPGKTGKHLVSDICPGLLLYSYDRNLDREPLIYLLVATSTSSENTKFCE